MKFLDQAKIFIKSGSGGAGSVSFRREKYVEFGGPDGGSGGRGGDVIVQCVDGLNTLIDYRYQQHFKAGTGTHGMGRQRTGGDGNDVFLKVPVGTQIFAEDNETLMQTSPKWAKKWFCLKAAMAALAICTSRTPPTKRRAMPTLALQARKCGFGFA